jgi:hypothetical protein
VWRRRVGIQSEHLIGQADCLRTDRLFLDLANGKERHQRLHSMPKESLSPVARLLPTRQLTEHEKRYFDTRFSTEVQIWGQNYENSFKAEISSQKVVQMPIAELAITFGEP